MNLIYNPKKTELIDIDDVIRDWNPFLNYIFNRENPSRKKGLPQDWDLIKHYGLDIVEFYQVKHAEEIYTEAPLMNGAMEFLNELRKIRKIFLISSQPNKQTEEYTKYWMIDKGIPFDYYKFTHNKEDYEGNHLLDDGIHNLEAALKSGKSTPICFQREWNMGKWHPKYTVKTHQEFLDLVGNYHSI